MDDSPSFSLGLTQIDHIEQSNQGFRFFPGCFDYEDSIFCENRSKHRSDPVKMKSMSSVAYSSSKNQVDQFQGRGEKKIHHDPVSLR